MTATYGIGIMGAVQAPPPQPAAQPQGNTPPQAQGGQCVWGNNNCSRQPDNGAPGSTGNNGTPGTNGVQGLPALGAEINLTTLTGLLVIASQGGPGQEGGRAAMEHKGGMGAKVETVQPARPRAAMPATAAMEPTECLGAEAATVATAAPPPK